MTPPAPAPVPSFGRWMGSLWLYTLLRFALFAVLWGLLWMLGLETLLAGIVALALSVPLSYVLLARPRQAIAQQIEARVEAQRAARAELDGELDPDNARQSAEDA